MDTDGVVIRITDGEVLITAVAGTEDIIQDGITDGTMVGTVVLAGIHDLFDLQVLVRVRAQTQEQTPVEQPSMHLESESTATRPETDEWIKPLLEVDLSALFKKMMVQGPQDQV